MYDTARHRANFGLVISYFIYKHSTNLNRNFTTVFH